MYEDGVHDVRWHRLGLANPIDSEDGNAGGPRTPGQAEDLHQALHVTSQTPNRKTPPWLVAVLTTSCNALPLDRKQRRIVRLDARGAQRGICPGNCRRGPLSWSLRRRKGRGPRAVGPGLHDF